MSQLASAPALLAQLGGRRQGQRSGEPCAPAGASPAPAQPTCHTWLPARASPRRDCHPHRQPRGLAQRHPDHRRARLAEPGAAGEWWRAQQRLMRHTCLPAALPGHRSSASRPCRALTKPLSVSTSTPQTAGIPKTKIGGFRAPFLVFDPQQREVLQKAGEQGLDPVLVRCGAGAGGFDSSGAERRRDGGMRAGGGGPPTADAPTTPAPQASGSTPPSASSTPPRPRPLRRSACGPTPWTTACPRTAASGAGEGGCAGWLGARARRQEEGLRCRSLLPRARLCPAPPTPNADSPLTPPSYPPPAPQHGPVR